MLEPLLTPKERHVFAKPPCDAEPGAAARPDTLQTLGENHRSSAGDGRDCTEQDARAGSVCV